MKIIYKHKKTLLGSFCKIYNGLGFDVLSFDNLSDAKEAAEVFEQKKIYKTVNHYNVLIPII